MEKIEINENVIGGFANTILKECGLMLSTYDELCVLDEDTLHEKIEEYFVKQFTD